jgi:predicted NUDIX family phosphoesterase
MEFVYVVKRYELFDLSFPHGFLHRGEDPRQVERYLDRIRERGFFLERRRAERDSSFKQVIPYGIVTHGEEALLLHRFSTQAESRLHDKLSIGVGGHINPADGGGGGESSQDGDLLDAGMRRELLEELVIDGEWSHGVVGVINDESNDVGSVHFGVVCRVRLESRGARVRESDKMDGEFLSVSALRETWIGKRSRFESWSDLILGKLDLVFS